MWCATRPVPRCVRSRRWRQSWPRCAPRASGWNTGWTEESSRLIAKGIAAHASTPDGSRNATHELAKTLAACTKLPESDRKAMEKLVAVLGDSYGEAIGIAATDEQSGQADLLQTASPR